MAIKVTTIVCMDNGEKIELEYKPTDLLEMITDKEGKPLDKFIQFGMDLINPKHISALYWTETEENTGYDILDYAKLTK